MDEVDADDELRENAMGCVRVTVDMVAVVAVIRLGKAG